MEDGSAQLVGPVMVAIALLLLVAWTWLVARVPSLGWRWVAFAAGLLVLPLMFFALFYGVWIAVVGGGN